MFLTKEEKREAAYIEKCIAAHEKSKKHHFIYRSISRSLAVDQLEITENQAQKLVEWGVICIVGGNDQEEFYHLIEK